MTEHEQQQEMDLGPTERLGGFMDEIRQQEAIKKRKLELSTKVCEIIEEVFEEAYKVFENPNPRDIGIAIAELSRPVIEEYRKIVKGDLFSKE